MTIKRIKVKESNVVDLAEHFRVSEQCVYNWTKRYKDFPDPLYVFRRFKVYNLYEVIEWAKDHSLPDRSKTIL